MRKSYRRSLAGWFLLTTTILVLVGVVVYRSISGFIRDTRWVDHTHMVLQTLDDTALSLATAESAQRGYIVTGKREYLIPFYEVRPHIDDDIKKIQDMIADNPDQRARVATLRRQIADRFISLDRVLVLRETSFEAAQTAILTNRGRKQMEAVRTTIGEIADAERTLLRERSSAAEEAAGRTLWISIGGIVVCCIVLLSMLVLTGVEAKRREAAEVGLQSANIELQTSLAHMQRLTQQATLLGSMGDMLQSCRSTVEAYTVVARTVPQLMPGTAGALCILNSSQNLVESVVQWGAIEGA